MTVQIIKNFISPDYANEIIKNSENLLREAPRSGYFETHHRYVPAPFEEQDFSLEDYDFLDTESKKRGASLISNALFLAQKAVEEFYGVKTKDCQGGLVKLIKGAKNKLHSDMYKLDGSQWDDGSGREDEYQYSALLYLSTQNKDFFGGEIIFPQHKITILPETGTLVFFRGDLDHIHEVKEITDGSRYALIMFFEV
jgi:hypothetical protein